MELIFLTWVVMSSIAAILVYAFDPKATVLNALYFFFVWPVFIVIAPYFVIREIVNR